MIHIVTAENRHLFRHALMEMHRQRKAVFIDELGWDLEAPEGFEIDAFDAEAAIYLIAAEAPRAPVLASLRLLPTDRPHLMSEVFAHLCEQGVPCAATTWEASRFCPAPGASAAERRRLVATMIAGAVETALLFGIETITYVAGAAVAPLATQAGWRVEALGARARYRDRA
jgi:acyl-homoserine lactone synthase